MKPHEDALLSSSIDGMMMDLDEVVVDDLDLQALFPSELDFGWGSTTTEGDSSEASQTPSSTPKKMKKKRKAEEKEAVLEEALALPAAGASLLLPQEVALKVSSAQFDAYLDAVCKERNVGAAQLKELKAQRKKIKNREYAKSKRAAKKNKEASKQEQLQELRDENARLRERVSYLEKENAHLRSQVGSRVAGSPLHFFVVLFAVGLSLSLIGLPALQQNASTAVSTSRALLWDFGTGEAGSACSWANWTACLEAIGVY